MSAERPTLASLQLLGPDRAAAFWLERLRDEDGYEDDHALREWLAASDRNREAWERTLDAWEDPEAKAERAVTCSTSSTAARPWRRDDRTRWMPYVTTGLAVAIITALVLRNEADVPPRH